MCLYHPPSEARAPLEQFGGIQPGVMQLSTFRAVVDDLRRLGTKQVSLAGRGEPLLNPAFVEMVAFAKEAGLEVSITSNGSRLTESRARSLVELGMEHFR